MNKPFNRVTSLVKAELLELVCCIFNLNCDKSQSVNPYMRFGYIKI